MVTNKYMGDLNFPVNCSVEADCESFPLPTEAIIINLGDGRKLRIELNIIEDVPRSWLFEHSTKEPKKKKIKALKGDK